MIFCHEQELDVETETIYGHDVQQRTKLDHIEGLKTALGVCESEAGHCPYHEVHHLTALLATPRLMSTDQASVESS